MAPHSTVTKEERPPTELEVLRGRDPLLHYEHRLRTDGVLDDHGFARLCALVDDEINQAVQFAEDALWPDGESAVLDA